jgi:hypothetical protein
MPAKFGCHAKHKRVFNLDEAIRFLLDFYEAKGVE